MKINQLKSGVLLSYLSQAIHMLSGLIYTPIMLRLLGQSEYGLYQLVSSVVSYLGLLSMGFNGGYIRFYARFKADDDEEGIARLNGMFFIIFLVIAAICAFCGTVMTIRADLIFGNGLTALELEKAKVLMAIMVFNLTLTFTETIFVVHVTAKEQFFFQRIINVIKALFNPFLTLPLLMIGYGSVSMVVVTTLLNVIAYFVNVWFSKKKLGIRFVFKGFDYKLLRELWAFTFFIFLNIIIDEINWHIDKYLLGRMIGTVAVAIYGVAANLNRMYMTFSSAISGVFAPRINRMVAEQNDDKELTVLFTKIGRIQFIIVALIISGYIIYGKEFIGIWAGDGYGEAYYVGLFLMVPLVIPLIQNLGLEIQRAKNKHKVRSVVYFFIAIVNIFVSILLIKRFGVIGASIGTALSVVGGNCIFMNIYYHKGLGLDMIYFWKEVLKFIPAVGISVICGLAMKMLIGCSGFVMLAVNIVLYCLFYVLVQWFVGMNEYERATFGKPIKKIGAKLCRK